MVYDLKYHLTTIVAIFLALAVGILVGSSFIAGSSVKDLEGEFVKIRAENIQQKKVAEGLSEQVKKHTEFERAVAPALVDNRLWGRNIAIIQTGDYGEATQSAKAILEQAGAQVVSVTTLHNMYSNSSNNRMIRALKIINGGPIDESNPTSSVLSIIADCIVNGSNPGAMEVLEDNRLLSTAGKYDRHVVHMVLVGGSKDGTLKTSSILDPTLIDKLKAAGVTTLVGVEPLDAGMSFIPAYHVKQIPTVDNIDQYIGQVGLVYAIHGEPGHFGVKRTSDRVAPQSLPGGVLHRGKRW